MHYVQLSFVFLFENACLFGKINFCRPSIQTCDGKLARAKSKWNMVDKHRRLVWVSSPLTILYNFAQSFNFPIPGLIINEKKEEVTKSVKLWKNRKLFFRDGVSVCYLEIAAATIIKYRYFFFFFIWYISKNSKFLKIYRKNRDAVTMIRKVRNK